MRIRRRYQYAWGSHIAKITEAARNGEAVALGIIQVSQNLNGNIAVLQHMRGLI